jgi:hypothetical protein
MGFYLEVICIILHAPLDIFLEIISTRVRHEENVRKYKYERKKYLYWDQVNDETK